MSSNSLLLVDPDFQPEASENSHLLLKITNDSFSYAIVDQDSGAVRVIYDQQGCTRLADTVANRFKDDRFLHLHFSQIKAAIHTAHFIFVPDEWFDAQNLEVYHHFLISADPIRQVHQQDLGFHTLFQVDGKLANPIPQQSLIYPQSAPLLALSGHLNANALFIDFSLSSFNVLLMRDGHFHFQNHYEADDVAEFNYYLLLMIEQLSLTESVSVYLSGIINEDDNYYNTLLKYFNNLYFFLPVENQNSELLADMPPHYFSGLLAINLCA